MKIEKSKTDQVKSLGSKQVLITGQCCETTCYMFVDSGSSVNLVSSGFIKSLGLESKVKPCDLKLASFSQDTIPIRGEINLTVTVAGTKFEGRFVVSDLLDTEFLVGDPFLRQAGVSIDYKESVLRFPSGAITPFKQKPRNVKKTMKVRCNKVTTIPANTVMYIEGRIPQTHDDHQGLIEPYVNTMVKTGLLFANAVVHSQCRSVPIKCINANDEPITIYKNKLLAYLQPLGDHKSIHGFRRVDMEEQAHSGPKTSTGSNGSHWREDCVSVDSMGSITPEDRKEKWTKEELFERLKLEELQVEMNNSERDRLKTIIWKNRSCFSYDEFDIGCCNMFEGNLQLKEGADPSWTTPIPTPYKLQAEMDKQIGEMVKAGVVMPLDEPSEFNSPVFLVLKKTTPQRWRLVMDLRNVNKACMDEKYLLPNLNHVLDTIGSDSIFSCFDLSKSFWQIPYSKDSRKITAFLHRARTYCFARVVMGHKNSSSIFQKMMDRLLATVPIEQLIFFIDDLFLSSSDVTSHLDRLEILLQRLTSAGLRLTPDKCKLMSKVTKFLGVSISNEGIRITEDRVSDLLDIPAPTSVNNVPSLLGAFNYVRKWIPQYSEITKPLHKLTAKGSRFEWTKECQDSFDELKKRVAESTTLCIPDTEDPFKSYHVTIDASKHGYGATLSQEIERQGVRERRIVAFYSKAVPPFKREQGQTRLEFDAMVLALNHWKVYLRNTSFKVITDCKSLLSSNDKLFAKSDPTLIRKCQELGNYDFVIEHVEGKKNTLCDFLSRFPFQRKMRDQGTQVEERKVEINVRTVMAEVAVGTDEDCLDVAVVEGQRCDEEMKNGSKRELAYEVIYEEVGKADQEEQRRVEKEEKEEMKISGKEAVRLCEEGEYKEEKCLEAMVSKVCEDFKDNAINEDQNEMTDLQLLFETEHEGEVRIMCINPVAVECICGIPEMEDTCSRKSSQQVTFAVAEVESEIQTLPDLKKLEEEQDNDLILKVVKQWVLDGEKGKIQVNRAPAALVCYWKQFSLLKIENGLLKRRWLRKKEDDCRDLIVVPESCEVEIMQLFHDNVTSCHPGANISVAHCRQYFYWYKMEQEFKLYIQACTRCNEMKQHHHYLKAPLKHLFFHCFNDALIVDHIVPEAEGKTARGNRYILSLTDAWSNYVVAVAVRSQTAKENIAAIMKNWVLKHGVCRELIVDNHPGFTADFFAAVWAYFDCKKTHGTSYKSASTARAENSNKRINQALRAVIPLGKERNWDLYLDKVVFALNCLKNRRTGFSANKMVFIREMNIPLSLMLDSDTHQPVKSSQAGKDAYELHREMKRIIRKVRENSDVDFRYAQNSHDRNLMGPFFTEGSYCFVLINCKKHKFSPRFRGPFRVNKVINDHLYVVQITPTMEKVVNISKMKHYPINKYSKKKLDEVKTPVRSQVEKNTVCTRSEIEHDSENSSDEDIKLEFRAARNALPKSSVVPQSKRDLNESFMSPDAPAFIPIVTNDLLDRSHHESFMSPDAPAFIPIVTNDLLPLMESTDKSPGQSEIETTYYPCPTNQSPPYKRERRILPPIPTEASPVITEYENPSNSRTEERVVVEDRTQGRRPGLRPRSVIRKPDYLTYSIQENEEIKQVSR